ncbi:unnamed protein product [Vitrella brassicaformis CCMP3155]|uniref:Potassium channel tetramerisation-type BTB domain-containing protein n=2 Tax=Vitrella brassicaformis TaxID=1169539 RepID=A0A0G4F542_VITBC|nr:unnamed protein product [Vitrella brassicaformis CCMP3155]|eukprot:CEM06957.1 unnamed protein product [Vitrella brassicaformis CCMP3155]
MGSLNRVEATSALDTQVRLALEGLQAQRQEISAMRESIKDRNLKASVRSHPTPASTTKPMANKMASIFLACTKGAADASNGLSTTSATTTASNSSGEDDLLHLNVGGSVSRMRRRHLTASGAEGTLLAALFSGRWDECFLKDSSGRMFLDVDSAAFSSIRNAIFAGEREGVDDLVKAAHRRNLKGPHDFYIKLLLSPLKEPDDGTAQQQQQQSVVSTAHAKLSGLLSSVATFVKAFDAEQAKLDQEMELLKTETESVNPFLKPLYGDSETICSVDVCGRTISTLKSTIDEMGDVALGRRHDASLWSAPIESVSDAHIRRLVDFYRRKRLAAAFSDRKPYLRDAVRVPLRMATPAEQRFFEKTAAMYGILIEIDLSLPDDSGDGDYKRTPLGVLYRIVQPGNGTTPRLTQQITFDHISWKDAFDAADVWHQHRGQTVGFTRLLTWSAEAFLSMSEGEVRRLIVPASVNGWGATSYSELKLISIK